MTVDEALDELYGAELGDFVAERNRLAKELGGDEGKEVAKLRKPSVAAWTLNQLARRNRRDVDLLLDAGHRLRQAQAGVLRGEEKQAFELMEAGVFRHVRSGAVGDAIKRLMKAAQDLGVSSAVLTKVNEGLRAAAVTEEGRELLARGRFTEPPAASGFEAFAGMEVPARRRGPAPKKTARRTDERRQAAAELRELEKQLHAAERAADRAEAAAEKARADAAALADEVEAAQERLRNLRD